MEQKNITLTIYYTSRVGGKQMHRSSDPPILTEDRASKATTIGTGCYTIKLYGLRINAFSNASMPMSVPFTVKRPLGSPERFRR